MTHEEYMRLNKMTAIFWSCLTDKEKDEYYDHTGTIKFVECVANMLNICLTGDDDDTLCKLQMNCSRRLCQNSSTLRGMYVPTDDITVIAEDTYNKDNELIRVEITGFYYGEPNEQFNEAFNHSLIVTFD